MATIKISGLSLGTPLPTDVYPAVDTTDTSMAPTGTTKKYSLLALMQATNFRANVVTVSNLNATYNNVAGTLTNAGTLAAFSADGISPSTGAYILVTGQSSPAQNGLYTLTTVGSGAAAWVLTRASNFNSTATIIPGVTVSVYAGTTYGYTQWIQTASVPILGTSAITFVQQDAAGTGLSKTQNIISLSTPVSGANGGTGIANTGSTLTITGAASISGANTGDQNLFSNIPVSGQTTVTANSTTTALTFVAGSNMTITTDNTAKTITFASSGGGGGGTVTSFSSGNLSPLFTTSVATATTTPALSFSLSNAGANTYFGNATGSSAAPSYTSAGALSKTDDTNVTLTLGGAPTTALLTATSLTLGWTGQLALSRGGTNADLSSAVSNGGIVYSTASALGILAGTATANRILMSGSSTTPAWSTATYPSTATTSGAVLVANGTNWVASTATFPVSAGTAGTILRSNGTNWVNSTATFSDTYVSGGILYSSGTNTVTSNSGFTFSSGVVKLGASLGILNGMSVGDGASTATFGVGQGTSNYVKLEWVYNATPSSAYAVLQTNAGSNDLVIQGAGGKAIFANTALSLYDTAGDNYVTFQINEDQAANRTLSWQLGAANRAITLTGNPTLADWFDQGVKTTSSPTFAALTLTSPLTVPNGGTGIASANPYGVVCAGTTSTGGWQVLGSVGTAGQVLTSNGASALPSWQSVAGGGVSSITGTSNQIAANGSYTVAQTGAVTLTLPQDINTTSSVSFGQVTVDNLQINGNDITATSGNINLTNTTVISGNTQMVNNAVGDGGYSLYFYKSDNNTDTTSGANLGRFYFYGYASSGFQNAARIEINQSDASSGANIPTELRVYQTDATAGIRQTIYTDGLGDFYLSVGDLYIETDNKGIVFGAGYKSKIYYDGTNTIWNLQQAGGGNLKFIIGDNRSDGALLIDQLDTGDCAIQFSLNAGQQYCLGIDNSASDAFVLSVGSAIGTGNVFSVSTAGVFSLTTALAVSSGGTGASTLTANGILIGNGTSAVSATTLTNGQVLIGSTGSAPVAATLTAGSNISITNGAGSITIAATGGGGGVTTVEVTGTTQAMSVNTRYIANNASLVTLTLPASASLGDVIIIVGKGAGGWSIAQNSGQTIYLGSASTTTGAGGSVGGIQYTSITLSCITANNDWIVESCTGMDLAFV